MFFFRNSRLQKFYLNNLLLKFLFLPTPYLLYRWFKILKSIIYYFESFQQYYFLSDINRICLNLGLCKIVIVVKVNYFECKIIIAFLRSGREVNIYENFNHCPQLENFNIFKWYNIYFILVCAAHAILLDWNLINIHLKKSGGNSFFCISRNPGYFLIKSYLSSMF